MSHFIVHTGSKHPGIVLYVCPSPTWSKGKALRGERDAAIKFPTAFKADLAIRHFSSAYGLVITEIK